MTLSEKITQLVVNDYFTPNIKAEVILDTLLTNYIAKIVKDQMGTKVGKLTFLTKEMSIEEADTDDQDTKSDSSSEDENEGGGDDRGAKIDYVLEEENGCVYLVELKTTKGSISNKQIGRYIKNCCGETFGTAMGEKLLRIIGKNYLTDKTWTVENLAIRFQTVTAGCSGTTNEERARFYLKTTGRASTNKYLYTVGQLLDHHPGSLQELWDAPLRLIYLTPDGGNVLPNSSRKKRTQEQVEAEQDFKQQWDKLYRGPNGSDSSISLKASVDTLRATGDELARLLAEIIEAIYLPKMEEK